MHPWLGSLLFLGSLILFGFSAAVLWRLFGGRPDLGASLGVMLLGWVWLLLLNFGRYAVQMSAVSIGFLCFPALGAAIGHVMLRKLGQSSLP